MGAVVSIKTIDKTVGCDIHATPLKRSRRRLCHSSHCSPQTTRIHSSSN